MSRSHGVWMTLNVAGSALLALGVALLVAPGTAVAAGSHSGAAAAHAAAPDDGGHRHAGHERKFDDPQEYTKSWDDPQRDGWQKPADLVAALGVRPGMAVADIGTGTGYLLPHLSLATGPQGKVFAVDISPKMLEWVAARAQREGLPNVTTVTASAGASGLPADSIDRAIMINVWHHVEDTARYAQDLRLALRPGGVVFIVEARPELKEEDGPPAHYRMQPDQVIEQLKKAGLRARLEPLALERQYVVRGER